MSRCPLFTPGVTKTKARPSLAAYPSCVLGEYIAGPAGGAYARSAPREAVLAGHAPLGWRPAATGRALARSGGQRGGTIMAYDLLIKNGRVVDGSGEPAFQRMSRSKRQDCRGRQIRRRCRQANDRRRRAASSRPGSSTTTRISTRRPCGTPIAARGCTTATPRSSSANAARSSRRSGRATVTGISNSSPTRNRSRYRS